MITSSEWCALPGSVESNKLGVNIKLGIESVSTQTGILLYPNPNTGSFTLDINDSISQTTSLNIFNSLGQIIYSNTLDKTMTLISLPVSVPSGNYTLRLTSNERSEVLRFTLSR